MTVSQIVNRSLPNCIKYNLLTLTRNRTSSSRSSEHFLNRLPFTLRSYETESAAMLDDKILRGTACCLYAETGNVDGFDAQHARPPEGPESGRRSPDQAPARGQHCI